MITFKKFAMAVMLIAGFQQASADVCKLKVKDDLFNDHQGYVYNDVTIYIGNDGKYYVQHYDSKRKTPIISTVGVKKAVTTGLEYSSLRYNHTANKTYTKVVRIKRKKPKVGSRKYSYFELVPSQKSNIIYCNDKNEVIINLNNVDKDKKRLEAKRQFENIIKCGLVDNHIINAQIYNTQFTDRATWKMPGISADISDLSVSNIPVMCGAKTECDNTNALWEKQDWINFCNNIQNVTKNLQRFEHTERQLLAYYISGQTYDDKAWSSTGQIVNNKIGNSEQHYLIYTHGAPCFDEGKYGCSDNGGMCCWNLYRHCVPNNIHVDVYFEIFDSKCLSEIHRRINILGTDNIPEVSDTDNVQSIVLQSKYSNDVFIQDIVKSYQNIQDKKIPIDGVKFTESILRNRFIISVANKFLMDKVKLLTNGKSVIDVFPKTVESVNDIIKDGKSRTQEHVNKLNKILPITLNATDINKILSKNISESDKRKKIENLFTQLIIKLMEKCAKDPDVCTNVAKKIDSQYIKSFYVYFLREILIYCENANISSKEAKQELIETINQHTIPQVRYNWM